MKRVCFYNGFLPFSGRLSESAMTNPHNFSETTKLFRYIKIISEPSLIST